MKKEEIDIKDFPVLVNTGQSIESAILIKKEASAYYIDLEYSIIDNLGKYLKKELCLMSESFRTENDKSYDILYVEEQTDWTNKLKFKLIFDITACS